MSPRRRTETVTKRKIIVQKFGGTSVTVPQDREKALGHVRREIDSGNQVALVVSAMGRRGDPFATDTLLDLLRNLDGPIDPRTYAFLFVTGEMISVAVMTHALQTQGIPAVALTGGMAGIVTEERHVNAQVLDLDGELLRALLDQGKVPVVCGGQGVTQNARDFSLLGRDSSDTSGVLVGLMVRADRVDIYTDVEYVYAADPSLVPNPPRRVRVSYEGALDMARFGAKVIHAGAVQLAQQHSIPLGLRSTFSASSGSLVVAEDDGYPLLGLPLLVPVRTAALPAQAIDVVRRTSLEQHAGVLCLLDEHRGDLILCARNSDIAGLADAALAAMGLGPIEWEAQCSLLSLVRAEGGVQEAAREASDVLRRHAIECWGREVSPRRVTLVLPAEKAAQALGLVFEALRGYLQPTTTTALAG